MYFILSMVNPWECDEKAISGFVSQIIFEILGASWDILLDSSVYILGGILIAGVLKVMLSPELIVNHLGRGRYTSVVKAAFFGIPLPL